MTTDFHKSGISAYFESIKRDCWALIERKYSEDKTKYDLARELVERSIQDRKGSGKVSILDAGCGHSSYDVDSNCSLIGTDIVSDDLKANRALDLRFASSLIEMPLLGETIDIVVCNMVLEHLEDPTSFFREAHRVLKPGGYLIFSTPCIYNIVVMGNRCLPGRLSQRLGSYLTGVSECDIFPTRYRANSIKRLRTLMRLSGLEEVEVLMHQPPPFAFVFSRSICRLVIGYFKVINRYESLKWLRGVIIGRCRKEGK